MELPDPSGSFYCRIPVMDPRYLGVTPGSGGSGSSGNEGRSAVYTSSRRRSRMSSPSTGIRLMPQFNAAVDGGGSGFSSSSSFRGVDLGLVEPHLRHSRHRVYPEGSPTPSNMGRLLLLSPVGSPAATDDDVLIMDGVLVDNNGSSSASGTRLSASFVDNNGSGTRRSASFSDIGVVSSGSPGSSGGSNGQFAQGREESRGTQAMKPRFSEVGSPSSRPAQGAGSSNMQGSPITPPLRPPSLPGPALPTIAPRGASAAVSIRPPASYFTPPRVSVPAAEPGPSAAPKQPETQTFSWPPTAEDDASITEKLYGHSSSGRPRLPVFRDICPAQ